MRPVANISVFWDLIKTGLWEDADVNLHLNDKVDWEEVYQLSTEQSVVGLVLAGLEHSELKPPQLLLLQWIGEVQVIEQRNKDMNAFVAELIEKLRRHDTYALLVKGQGLAQCYEKPLWRTCGDIDLFLSEDNYQKAKELLLPCSQFQEKEVEYDKHLGMTIDGWAVELHGHLYSGLSSRVEKELDALQQDTFYRGEVRSWMNGKTHIFLLKAENDAFYVFTHILQHFYKEGVGLRQVCDWCRLLYTYKDSMNYGLLESRIKRAGLMSEWRSFATLAVEYLGMPVDAMPFYSNSLKWKKKADRIMEFILKSGNMGHNRDMSHFSKYPYLVRKCVSMGRRIGDLYNHARIFPVDSLKFFPRIMFNGVRSAIRGE